MRQAVTVSSNCRYQSINFNNFQGTGRTSNLSVNTSPVPSLYPYHSHTLFRIRFPHEHFFMSLFYITLINLQSKYDHGRPKSIGYGTCHVQFIVTSFRLDFWIIWANKMYHMYAEGIVSVIHSYLKLAVASYKIVRWLSLLILYPRVHRCIIGGGSEKMLFSRKIRIAS